MDGPYIPRKTRYTLSNMDFSLLTGKCIDSRRLWALGLCHWNPPLPSCVNRAGAEVSWEVPLVVLARHRVGTGHQ